MATALVGRIRELQEIEALLGDSAGGCRALLYEGPPGIGKTTVWDAAIRDARSRSLQVLSCRLTEAESSLPFVGLVDLFDEVVDDLDLSAPQRRAFDVALRRVTGDAGADRLTLGLAVLAALQSLAAGGTVVVAVDDLQWLDAPTAAALEFAFRRLDIEPVMLLAAVRTDETHRLLGAFDEARVQRRVLAPLRPDETEALLLERVGIGVTRPALSRIHAATGGNPLFALELGRALARSGAVVTPGESLPVPDSLAQLVTARLDAFSPATRDVLLVVAALAQPTRQSVGTVAADTDEAIAQAVSAGILVDDGSRLAFAHPLFASAVYGGAVPTRLREIHRQLSHAVADPDERVVHLARGTEAPDEQTAVVLEHAAGRAARRGAPETAAELAQHAQRLTPSDDADAAARRALAGAAYTWSAGDGITSRRLIEELLATLAPGALRARARYQLTRIVDDLPSTIVHLEEALLEAARDPGLSASLHTLLARQHTWGGDPAAGARSARSGAEIAAAAGADAELAAALGWEALAEVFSGRATPVAKFDRAVALEQLHAGQIGVTDLPTRNRGVAAMLDGDLASARLFLVIAHGRAASRSDSSRAIILLNLAEVDLREGNTAAAVATIREAEDMGRQWGLAHAEASVLAVRAFVDAWRGDVESARSSGARAIEMMRPAGYEVIVRRAERALGFLELSLGNPLAADAMLAPLIERASLADPWAAEAAPDEIEALVALGRVDEAAALLAVFERLERLRPGAVARSHALVRAKRGNLVSAAEAASSAASAASEPFDLAHSLLVVGTIERRRRRKREARAALEHARDVFRFIGAELWEARAEAELTRTGLRHTRAGGLTPTEQRVADLAAAGAKNREIADSLFMSVKTVEANLSRVYRKLGVRSRTQLARRLPDS